MVGLGLRVQQPPRLGARRPVGVGQKDKEPVAPDVLRTLRNLNAPPADSAGGRPHGEPVPIIQIPEPSPRAADAMPVYRTRRTPLAGATTSARPSDGRCLGHGAVAP